MSYGIRHKFYQSKAWKTVKNNIWLKQSCLCAICHKPVYVDGISDYIPKDKRRIGIVHHKVWLNDDNVNNQEISLDESNLIGICKDCHEKEHHQDISTRPGVKFDSDGNLIKE